MERSNGGTTIALIQSTRAENDHKKRCSVMPRGALGTLGHNDGGTRSRRSARSKGRDGRTESVASRSVALLRRRGLTHLPHICRKRLGKVAVPPHRAEVGYR